MFQSPVNSSSPLSVAEEIDRRRLEGEKRSARRQAKQDYPLTIPRRVIR